MKKGLRITLTVLGSILALLLVAFCITLTPRFWDKVSDHMMYGKVKDPLVRTDTYVYSRNKDENGHRLRLDVYTSPGTEWDGPRPVLFHIHGGGWNSVSNRTGGQMWQRFFARLGYVCVSIDYREGNELICKGKAPFTDLSLRNCMDYATRLALEDVFDAATYFVENLAERYNADVTKIVAVGGSAGAINSINAEYAICNGDPLAVEHLPKGFNFAGVISQAGALEIAGTDPVRWEKTPCPILFYHGDDDIFVPYGTYRSGELHRVFSDDLPLLTGKHAKGLYVEEPEDFSAYGPESLIPSIEAAGGSYRLVLFPGADHTISMLPVYTDMDSMREFLERNVIAGEAVQETVIREFPDGQPRNQVWTQAHVKDFLGFRKLKDYVWKKLPREVAPDDEVRAGKPLTLHDARTPHP